jgi:hypothetical protein
MPLDLPRWQPLVAYTPGAVNVFPMPLTAFAAKRMAQRAKRKKE